MNPSRVVLAALGATVAYLVVGGLLFAALPSLKNEFLKYPAVYRSRAGQMRFMPAGMAAMFVAMLVLAVIYAMLCQGGSGIADGARFGALIGVFAVCAFVVHNHVNLNIGREKAHSQGGMLFGYDIGVIAGAILFIKTDFRVSPGITQ